MNKVNAYDINEFVTVKDMKEITKLGVITLTKILKGAELSTMAHYHKGGVGRPSRLFNRQQFIAAVEAYAAKSASKPQEDETPAVDAFDSGLASL